MRTCALSVDVDVRAAKDQRHSSHYVVALEDLQLFCQGLLLLENATTIHLIGVDPWTRIKRMIVNLLRPSLNHSLSGPLLKLLEPFATLRRIPNIEVTGPVGSVDTRDLECTVESPIHQAQALHGILAIKYKGDKAFKNADFLLAVETYEEVMRKIRLSCHTIDIRQPVEEGEFEGLAYRNAYYVIDFRLRVNIVAALMRLQA